MNWIRDALERLTEPDADAAALVRARADDILRPAGAFARLDEVAVHIAAWQRTANPAIERPAGIVFAADHGVAVHGAVSAYPTDVTAAMLDALEQKRATVCALAHAAGASVTAVDVGVGRPTGDIRFEPALSPDRFTEIVDTAVSVIAEIDADLLVVGEMGIGNTTVAAAVAHALLGDAPADWVGRGTGVDDDGLERKRDAVAAAAARVADVDDPLEILREVGGSELVAMAAAVVAARLRSIPVVLDGFVATAAVLPLHIARPGALDHCLAGHCSAEHAHRALLDRIGLAPLVDLDLRLGEGSGAMVAVPIVKMACTAVVDVPTFGEWFGPR